MALITEDRSFISKSTLTYRDNFILIPVLVELHRNKTCLKEKKNQALDQLKE